MPRRTIKSLEAELAKLSCLAIEAANKLSDSEADLKQAVYRVAYRDDTFTLPKVEVINDDVYDHLSKDYYP
jgi:hypothetical protein